MRPSPWSWLNVGRVYELTRFAQSSRLPFWTKIVFSDEIKLKYSNYMLLASLASNSHSLPAQSSLGATNISGRSKAPRLLAKGLLRSISISNLPYLTQTHASLFSFGTGFGGFPYLPQTNLISWRDLLHIELRTRDRSTPTK